MHWTKIRGRGGYRDEWYWLVKAKFHVNEPKASVFAFVTVVRVAKKILDYDNFVTGCKYLMDALTEYGHIVDDKPRWCSALYEQRKVGEEEDEHMEVSVRYIGQ